MEFDEVREYAARRRHPHDRLERDRTFGSSRIVKLVCRRTRAHRDVRRSTSRPPGSLRQREQLKNEVAAELCACWPSSAIKNNDKVGLLAFTDRVEKFIPPKKGSSHVLRLVRELLQFSPEGKGTNLSSALEYVGRVMRRRSIVFLVSDFIAEDYETPLRLVAKRNDLVAISVSDPRERALPDVGLIALEDAETGQTVVFDTNSAPARKAYSKLAGQSLDQRREAFRKAGVDEVQVNVGEDYVRDLMLFFRRRGQRL